MKRSISVLLAMLMVAALFSGCGAGGGDPALPAPVSSAPVSPAPEDVSWSGYSGTLSRRDSGQFDNAILQVRWLDDSSVLFALDLTEGSESEEATHSLQISGTMYVEGDGTGVYENVGEDGGAAYSIRFSRSKDGQLITVSHTGDAPMNPDGDYEYMDFSISANPGLAAALLESLPTAATSLDHNIGAYTFQFPTEGAPDYFYPVTAALDDTGAVLASFVLTEDLTAVWRLDTGDEIPILIFGEAQTMLDQVVYSASNGAEAAPLLPVILEGGALLKPGKSAGLRLDAPYAFPASFEQLLSSNEDVAAVDGDGTVTARAPGTTAITGSVVVEDGKRSFMLDISVDAGGGIAASAPVPAN